MPRWQRWVYAGYAARTETPSLRLLSPGAEHLRRQGFALPEWGATGARAALCLWRSGQLIAGMPPDQLTEHLLFDILHGPALLRQMGRA